MKLNKHKSSRGQTLVEFALALPILLFLVVAIFDLGRAVYYSSAIHNAAREGARYGIIHPDDYTGMQIQAQKYAVGLGLTGLDIIAGPGPNETVGGDVNYTVKVKISYSFTPATPLFDLILPDDGVTPRGTILLKGESIMRTEAKPSP